MMKENKDANALVDFIDRMSFIYIGHPRLPHGPMPWYYSLHHVERWCYGSYVYVVVRAGDGRCSWIMI
jgi:hypothetical protein